MGSELQTTVTSPRPLSDCSAVLTGGTSGVGLAVAEQLLAAGVPRLVLIGRDAERGRSALRHLAADARRARASFIQADANDPDEARRAGEEAAAQVGPIDVLVNSTTSSNVPDLLNDIPVERIATILTQQALAPLHMTRVVLPWMREERRGSIVNVASDAAKVPTPGESVIGAAMAAITMFSRTAALEAKRDGVRINVVTPSLIDGTPTSARVLETGFSAKLFRKAAAQAHLGLATPSDLAGLVVYLAGPSSARMTGQVISLNGGISV